MKSVMLCALLAAGSQAATPDPAASLVERHDKRVAELSAEFEKTPAAPNDVEWVKKKLEHMVAIDQIARTLTSGPDMSSLTTEQRDAANSLLIARMTRIDAANLADFKKLLEIHGWFNRSRFGERADFNAWLIVQHADGDSAFQADILARLEPLVARGESDPKLFAYLFDRVAVNTHPPGQRRLQRYGTQGQCTGPGAWAPHPTEDPDRLDARRAEVGLEPLAEYVKIFKNVCVESTEAALARAREAATKTSTAAPAK
jgi:hypothetical protein